MKLIRKVFLFCMTVLLWAILPLSVTAAEEDSVFSTALHNLAAETDMVVAASVGEEIYFSQESFCRALNLSSLEYITVTSLPSGEAGTLYLGASVVQAGQVISAGNLGKLSFTSASGKEGLASFTFTSGEGNYDISCRMYHVSEIGSAPTLSYAPNATLSVSTHRDLSLKSTLLGYDPDGDGMVFEVVKQPMHGSIRMVDRERGLYVYTPFRGYTGSDSFSYVARDVYGNYSEASEVKLAVSMPLVPVDYADLGDDGLLHAAITMEEEGLMGSREVGGELFFCPDEAVSRVDFLVMAMRACGIEADLSAGKTHFKDEGEIPEAFLPYVATAHELGVVNGVFTSEGLLFCPDRAVTRAEAAKILSVLLSLSSSVPEDLKNPSSIAASAVVIRDVILIPAWAEEAVCHLSAVGLLGTGGETIALNAALTRGEAAEMLTSLLHLLGSAQR